MRYLWHNKCGWCHWKLITFEKFQDVSKFAKKNKQKPGETYNYCMTAWNISNMGIGFTSFTERCSTWNLQHEAFSSQQPVFEKGCTCNPFIGCKWLNHGKSDGLTLNISGIEGWSRNLSVPNSPRVVSTKTTSKTPSWCKNSLTYLRNPLRPIRSSMQPSKVVIKYMYVYVISCHS